MDMKIKTSNKGIMGIGTLIIFIAIIIVSAIAAAVFIGSGASMEQRTLAAQKGTEQEVTTGVVVVNIVGLDARNDSNIEVLEVMMRLRSGSDPINLNTTVFTIDTQQSTQIIKYGGNGTASRSQYNVTFFQTGVNHKPGYITLGDTAKATLMLSDPITEHEEVTFQVVPRVGGVRRHVFRTPNVLVKRRTFLYP